MIDSARYQDEAEWWQCSNLIHMVQVKKQIFNY